MQRATSSLPRVARFPLLTAATIDLQSLLQATLAAVVAGVGLVLAFTLAVLGFARGPDLRQLGRPVAAGLWTALGVIALIAALGGAAYGLSIIVDVGAFG